MKNVYCLNVMEMRNIEVYKRALDQLDEERRNKALRYREMEDRIRSAGAGLLLQFAAQVVEETGEAVAEAFFAWKVLTAEEVLRRVHKKREFKYRIGADGKPYLREEAFQFSLSHSGDFVACAVSDMEVGADIQEKKASDYQKLVSRFFTVREQEVFAACSSERERRDLFYLLWTRKEAYGKLTGKGLKEGLNLMEVLEPEALQASFEDYAGLPGYQGCVCRWNERKSGGV